MSGEAPELRVSGVRAFTPSGWICGSLHLPRETPLLDHINVERRFFTLSDVQMATDTSLPFLALARSAVTLIIPSPDEHIQSQERSRSYTQIRQVSCVFEGGMVMGAMSLPLDCRVSDLLMRKDDFLLIEQCTIGLDGTKPQMEADAVVLIQATRLVGVAEVG